VKGAEEKGGPFAWLGGGIGPIVAAVWRERCYFRGSYTRVGGASDRDLKRRFYQKHMKKAQAEGVTSVLKKEGRPK